MFAAFCHWLLKPPEAASESGTERNAPSVRRLAYVSSALNRLRKSPLRPHSVSVRMAGLSFLLPSVLLLNVPPPRL